MRKTLGKNRFGGIMGRLRRDQAGNTLAMTAAALFPLLGIIGGAIDMSRTYAVKSKLQSACDAGVLAGLKTVSGNWNEDTDAQASAAALNMFNANLRSDAWGAKNVTPTFNVDEKKASADVPMAVMQMFGREVSTVSVECSGELQLPNADIMFVLDNTGSMNEPIPGDSTNTKKIDGLKVGVNCFYEILAREDNPDVTNEQCDYEVGAEPWNDEVDETIQLRFGFVPYDQMVNVGKLLPTKYFADTSEYQTRIANTVVDHTWTTGTNGTPAYTGWTPITIPATYYTRQSSSGWSDQTTNVSTEQGTKVARQTLATNAAQCNTYNDLAGSGSNLTGLSQAGGSISTSGGSTWTPAAPVHPNDLVQTSPYTQSQAITVTQWRYVWKTRSGQAGCYLERRNHSNTYTRTQSGSASRPINWTKRDLLVSWTYKKHPIEVKGLKNGEAAYNASIQLPMNEATINNVRRSGQSGTSNIKVVANRTVAWQGCIEERQTHQNIDGDPSDDYNPIPDAALDLKYANTDPDIVDPDPLNVATLWRFALRDASWGRTISGNRTLADVTTTSNLSQNFGWSCPTQARKLKEYKDAAGAQNFADYVDLLYPGGNTYHDIGLLWGARLMSKDGIFGRENRATRNSGEIRRHMVFMTDGETYNNVSNYTSYGLDWYDRRQTNPSSAPTNQLLIDSNDARSEALCRGIKAEKIELWVIYYGVPNGGTAARLQRCASDNNHFIVAQNTDFLVKAFKNVAKKIAELQLTE
jgi:Flp pilus assembly protein TadG